MRSQALWALTLTCLTFLVSPVTAGSAGEPAITLKPIAPVGHPKEHLGTLRPRSSGEHLFTPNGTDIDPEIATLFAEASITYQHPSVVLPHSDLVRFTHCLNNGIEIGFSSAKAYNFVKTHWSDFESEHFVLITESLHCNDADIGMHVYWLISELHFDDDLHTVIAVASEVPVGKAYNDVQLSWGSTNPHNDELGGGGANFEAHPHKRSFSSFRPTGPPPGLGKRADAPAAVFQPWFANIPQVNGTKIQFNSASVTPQYYFTPLPGQTISHSDRFTVITIVPNKGTNSTGYLVYGYGGQSANQIQPNAYYAVTNPARPLAPGYSLKTVAPGSCPVRLISYIFREPAILPTGVNAPSSRDGFNVTAYAQAAGLGAPIGTNLISVVNGPYSPTCDLPIVDNISSSSPISLVSSRVSSRMSSGSSFSKPSSSSAAVISSSKASSVASSSSASRPSSSAGSSSAPKPSASSSIRSASSASGSSASSKASSVASSSKASSVVSSSKTSSVASSSKMSSGVSSSKASSVASSSKASSNVSSASSSKASVVSSSKASSIVSSSKSSSVASSSKALSVISSSKASSAASSSNASSGVSSSKASSGVSSSKVSNAVSSSRVSSAGSSSKASSTSSKASSVSASSSSASSIASPIPVSNSCSNPPDTYLGVVAAACGPDFDAAKDARVGFYDLENEGDQSQFLASSSVIRSLHGRGWFSNLWKKIKNGVESAWRAVQNELEAIKKKAEQIYQESVREFNKVVDIIEDTLTKPIDAPFGQDFSVSVYPGKKVDSPWGTKDSVLIWSSNPDKEKESESDDDEDGFSKEVNIYCKECGVSGSALISGEVSFTLIPPSLSKAEIGIGGSIKAGINVGIEATVAYQKTLKKKLVTIVIPEAGVKVGDLLVVGLVLNVDAALSVNVKATGQALIGATVQIDGFNAVLDIRNGKVNTEGFDPVFNKGVAAQASGEISASVGLAVPVEFVLAFEIPPLDVEKVIGLRNTPQIQASALLHAGTAGSINSGNCRNGFEYSVDLSNKLDFDFLGKIVPLASIKKDGLAAGCLPIPGLPQSPSSSSSSSVAVTSSSSSSATVSSSSSVSSKVSSSTVSSSTSTSTSSSKASAGVSSFAASSSASSTSSASPGTPTSYPLAPDSPLKTGVEYSEFLSTFGHRLDYSDWNLDSRTKYECIRECEMTRGLDGSICFGIIWDKEIQICKAIFAAGANEIGLDAAESKYDTVLRTSCASLETALPGSVPSCLRYYNGINKSDFPVADDSPESDGSVEWASYTGYISYDGITPGYKPRAIQPSGMSMLECATKCFSDNACISAYLDGPKCFGNFGKDNVLYDRGGATRLIVPRSCADFSQDYDYAVKNCQKYFPGTLQPPVQASYPVAGDSPLQSGLEYAEFDATSTQAGAYTRHFNEPVSSVYECVETCKTESGYDDQGKVQRCIGVSVDPSQARSECYGLFSGSASGLSFSPDSTYKTIILSSCSSLEQSNPDQVASCLRYYHGIPPLVYDMAPDSPNGSGSDGDVEWAEYQGFRTFNIGQGTTKAFNTPGMSNFQCAKTCEKARSGGVPCVSSYVQGDQCIGNFMPPNSFGLTEDGSATAIIPMSCEAFGKLYPNANKNCRRYFPGDADVLTYENSPKQSGTAWTYFNNGRQLSLYAVSEITYNKPVNSLDQCITLCQSQADYQCAGVKYYASKQQCIFTDGVVAWSNFFDPTKPEVVAFISCASTSSQLGEYGCEDYFPGTNQIYGLAPISPLSASSGKYPEWTYIKSYGVETFGGSNCRSIPVTGCRDLACCVAQTRQYSAVVFSTTDGKFSCAGISRQDPRGQYTDYWPLKILYPDGGIILYQPPANAAPQIAESRWDVNDRFHPLRRIYFPTVNGKRELLHHRFSTIGSKRQTAADGAQIGADLEAALSQSILTDAAVVNAVQNASTTADTIPQDNFVVLRDPSGSFELAPQANGNLLLTKAGSQLSYRFATTDEGSVIGNGGSSGFIYDVREMQAFGVARFRFRPYDSVARSSRVASLVPINYDNNSNTPGVYVAIDTAGLVFYPVICSVAEGQTKTFLVKDPATGIPKLQSPELQVVVTGGPTTSCALMALVTVGNAGRG